MRQVHAHDLPEAAIAACERGTGCRICCHDLAGILWRHLDPRRFWHIWQPCALVKRHRQAACTAFDDGVARTALLHQPAGVVKRCHAGVVECAVAVRDAAGSPWLVLFAGAHRPGPGLTLDVAEAPGAPGPWSVSLPRLPALAEAEADLVLEQLRQLGDRLERWRAEHLPRLAAPPGAGQGRRETIQAWIVRHHREDVALADLARQLGLSVDRAGHAVAEACHAGFIELLTRERIRSAVELLRGTDLPVREVARASGFRNLAHFHERFRTALGHSPAAWRRLSGPASPPGSRRG